FRSRWESRRLAGRSAGLAVSGFGMVKTAPRPASLPLRRPPRGHPDRAVRFGRTRFGANHRAPPAGSARTGHAKVKSAAIHIAAPRAWQARVGRGNLGDSVESIS